MHFPLKWLNRKTNGTVRKCSSRTFRWMVMSVGFDNLISYLGNFCIPHLVTEVTIGELTLFNKTWSRYGYTASTKHSVKGNLCTCSLSIQVSGPDYCFPSYQYMMYCICSLVTSYSHTSASNLCRVQWGRIPWKKYLAQLCHDSTLLKRVEVRWPVMRSGSWRCHSLNSWRSQYYLHGPFDTRNFSP
jgi:hypothetical protein